MCDKKLNEKMKFPTAIYHLPGLFEFYELYRVFLPLFREIENIFMTGARSAQSTVHQPTACGVVDVSGKEIMIHGKFWHS